METNLTSLPISRVSVSALTCYEYCPLQFKFNYIDRVAVAIKTGAPAAFGQAVHQCIEEWYLGGQLTRRNLISRWAEIFEQTLSRPEVEKPDSSYRGFLLNRGYPLLQNFFNTHATQGLLVPPLGAELKFQVPWKSKYGEILLTGKIDLVIDDGNDTEIVDFKTGKDVPTQAEVDKDIQLTFYSLGYRWLRRQDPVKFPKIESSVALFYLSKNVKMYSVRGRDHYDALLMRVGVMLDGIMAGNFIGTPSMISCKWCIYSASCPFYKI